MIKKQYINLSQSYLIFFLSILIFSNFKSFADKETLKDTQRKVLIVSIDGLRPDLLLLAKAPNLKELISKSSYSLVARTTDLAITLPSHISMVTGVEPDKHGVTWNDDRSYDKTKYPKVPTIFDYAKKAKFVTALVTGKSKFNILNKNNNIDFFYAPKEKYSTDFEVAEMSIEALNTINPDITFIHFPEVDIIGHKFGWGSSEQMTTIGSVDGLFDKIQKIFLSKYWDKDYLIIVTSDHGGLGKNHGATIPESMFVPLIVNGQTIKRNFDLSSNGTIVRVSDVFKMTYSFLNLNSH
jgi:predicted AlkP superfamily pyrophosphatase or phosphodiesterase